MMRVRQDMVKLMLIGPMGEVFFSYVYSVAWLGVTDNGCIDNKL